MKKIFIIFITLIASILCFFSCNSQSNTNTQSQQNTEIIEYDIANFNNFKCEIHMGQTDENYVLEGEKAKELYNLILKYERTEIDGIPAYDSMDPSKDYIYLFFSAEKIENSEFPVEQLGHYGCFSIYTKDVVQYGVSPLVSVSYDYQFENGVYNEINSFIENEITSKE